MLEIIFWELYCYKWESLLSKVLTGEEPAQIINLVKLTLLYDSVALGANAGVDTYCDQIYEGMWSTGEKNNTSINSFPRKQKAH